MYRSVKKCFGEAAPSYYYGWYCIFWMKINKNLYLFHILVVWMEKLPRNIKSQTRTKDKNSSKRYNNNNNKFQLCICVKKCFTISHWALPTIVRRISYFITIFQCTVYSANSVLNHEVFRCVKLSFIPSVLVSFVVTNSSRTNVIRNFLSLSLYLITFTITALLKHFHASILCSIVYTHT